MTRFASLIFAAGLAFLLLVLFASFDFGAAPMRVGEGILAAAPEQTGAANIVTAVVLGYRGIDTLGEIAILFTAASAAGLVLGRRSQLRHKLRRKLRRRPDQDGGDVLGIGAQLLFPLLLIVGAYIILHGHLTPGGGFQGGVILAAAFILPTLARPSSLPSHGALSLVEALSGAAFIGIGLIALFDGGAFLQPLLAKGAIGELISAGTLPLLYLALGLKVGAELAGLLAHLAAGGAEES